VSDLVPGLQDRAGDGQPARRAAVPRGGRRGHAGHPVSVRRLQRRGVVAQGSVDRDGRREDGRAACVVYAWMAAEESRRRSGRTRAGLEREGLPVGRQARATDKPRRRQWLCCPLGTGASELRRGDACRRERPHQPGRRLRFADQDPQV